MIYFLITILTILPGIYISLTIVAPSSHFETASLPALIAPSLSISLETLTTSLVLPLTWTATSISSSTVLASSYSGHLATDKKPLTGGDTIVMENLKNLLTDVTNKVDDYDRDNLIQIFLIYFSYFSF